MPGHSVPVVAFDAAPAEAVLHVVRAPKPLRNEFASTLTVICGRTLRLWLTEPYDVRGHEVAARLQPHAAIGSRMKPVL